MFTKKRKDLTKEEFLDMLDSEKIAFYVYDFKVRKKIKDDYVDLIGTTYCDYNFHLKDKVVPFYLAKNILEKEYGIDMYSLPFYDDDFKLSIQKYDLLKQLEKYFEENNINYKSDELFSKGLELSKDDKNINDIMKKLVKINSQKISKYKDKNVHI